MSAAHADGLEPSDLDLLRAPPEEQRYALDLLFRRYSERLWRVAMRLLNHPQDAEDALQDALTRAFVYAEKYRADATVSTWLHRITINAAYDVGKRRRVWWAVNDLGVELIDPDGTIVFDEVESNAVLQAALALIPSMHRSAFVLSAYLGLSYEDTAEVLGVPIGTVRSRVSRARLSLGPLLGE